MSDNALGHFHNARMDITNQLETIPECAVLMLGILQVLEHGPDLIPLQIQPKDWSGRFTNFICIAKKN